MKGLDHPIKSMTAYGRASIDSAVGHFMGEVQTINRRHLEINVSLPRQLQRFEMSIRKWIEAKVGRGQINFSIFWREEKEKALTILPNIPFATSLKQALESLSKQLNIPCHLTLETLLQEKEVLIFHEEIKDEDEALCFEALHLLVDTTCDELMEMKWKEGAIIANDLMQRVHHLETLIHFVENNTANATSKYRLKLQKRLEELFTGHTENEEKILREIAIFAEKIDVTEEIVRFKSHLKQVLHLLVSPLKYLVETRGKTLDFLIQELHREVNTIGSKAVDVTIVEYVVTIKSEIEKMREQVQNIE